MGNLANLTAGHTLCQYGLKGGDQAAAVDFALVQTAQSAGVTPSTAPRMFSALRSAHVPAHVQMPPEIKIPAEFVTARKGEAD